MTAKGGTLVVRIDYLTLGPLKDSRAWDNISGVAMIGGVQWQVRATARYWAKAYPSGSGAAKCCRCGIGFMIEQITNMVTLGDADDRLPPLLDRVPAALPG